MSATPPTFRIDDIPKEGLELEVVLSPQWLASVLGDTEFGKDPVGGDAQVRVDRTGREVTLSGHVHVTLRPPCVRCLEPIECTVDERFRLRLVPAVATAPRPGREELELEEEELDTETYQGDQLELGPWLREQILVAAPAWPRHEEDCPLPQPSVGPAAGDAE